MAHDNHGSQSGDHGVNVGVGDFRGAHFQLGNQGRPTFTAEQMQIGRKLLLAGASVQGDNLNTFSIITGLASLAGLYFTLFSPFKQPQYSSLSFAFLFGLGIASTCWLISWVMKKQGFAHFLMGRMYVERAPNGKVFLTTLTAICPWCSSKMALRHYAPKGAVPCDFFICEKNPVQHHITLDHTCLPEIDTTGR
ncbi:hypothetical protein [Dyella sp.]|uniref:hypothetical protein n=1 Tax=Dyella sp. TaxID=1869338 RepID=UPI002B476F40|nr:hypothetical protein [Dyella sp.]HKT30039.1 hypothetical protein [Dyella sp.]